MDQEKEEEKEKERNMEQELIEQINAKKQEQYLATWGLIYQRNGILKDAEKDLKNAISNKVINITRYQNRVEEEKRTMEITWHIAERNKRIYEPEILYLREKLRSIQTNDVELMELVKCKHACFQLTGKYDASNLEIVANVENYKKMIENCVDDPTLIYCKLLYLFDLPGDTYKEMIDECYQMALEQDIYNFIGVYQRKYL